MCIVLLTGIGDVVHGLPLATDLKRDDPTRRVVWVAEPAPARVLDHHPDVDEVVVFHKRRGLAGLMALAESFRGRSCDLTLNMQRYLKGAFPALLSGAAVRVGLPPSKTRDGVAWLNTHHLPEGPWRHTQDMLLEYRDVLGLPPLARVLWRIRFSAPERAAQRRFLEALPPGRPVAGLVLGTANAKKDWPAERYPPLAAALTDMGYAVVLVGGPSPRERRVADLVLATRPAGVVDGLGDSVRAMMTQVDAADLLVSPDTGPLHIAHALDTPVVGLFGHTNPARVGPWRRFRDLVVDRYTDAGDPSDPSGYEPRMGRMETIAVEDVLSRVERARDRYGAGEGERSGARRSGALERAAPPDPGESRWPS
ncbi:MAG: glycosyltransferase family 9 protein [Gemmatimonadetes bacterium]|nr:glycosyltransferase family 9 protein [Gemmatimonadota bacterium]